MNWLSLALGLAGMGAKGAQWYQNSRAQRSMNAMQKAGLSFQRGSAHRNLAQLLEDIPRNRRRLEGSLADRGVADSSIAQQNLGYYDRRGQRQLEEGQGSVRMAEKQLSHFKKMIRRQRMANYLDLGVSLLGAGGNAALSLQQAPEKPFLSTLGNIDPSFQGPSPWDTQTQYSQWGTRYPVPLMRR